MEMSTKSSILTVAACLAGTILLTGSDAIAQNAKVGVTMPTVKGPFFSALLYGITDEAKKVGWKPIILDAGGYANVDQQVSDMQNLVAQNVAAILVDPSDQKAFGGALQDAKAAGIPVIGSGDPVAGANASVSASHCSLGVAMAEGMKKLLPHGGTMAALTGPAGAYWSTARWECFKKVLATTNLKIVAEQSSEPDAAIGLSIATDMLQRFPDVNLLYGADDTVGVGAARAVQAANRCGKTRVLTAILGETTQELLKAGCINYVVAQQTVLIGRESIRIAKEIVDGKKPKDTTVEVPVVAVTPENLASVDLSTVIQPRGWTP
jgi:ABC-type sugar transport system substrate-binding protein